MHVLATVQGFAQVFCCSSGEWSVMDACSGEEDAAVTPPWRSNSQDGPEAKSKPMPKKRKRSSSASPASSNAAASSAPPPPSTSPRRRRRPLPPPPPRPLREPPNIWPYYPPFLVCKVRLSLFIMCACALAACAVIAIAMAIGPLPLPWPWLPCHGHDQLRCITYVARIVASTRSAIQTSGVAQRGS